MEKTSPKIAQLFVTCLVDSFYPDVGMATVNLLEQQGFTVQFPEQQTCCGQPVFNAGHWDEARQMARHTLDLLAQTEGPIVIPSGSCTDMMIHHYHELFHDDPVYQDKLAAIADRTFELTQFLVDVLKLTDVGAHCNGCATYHPSCHGLRNLDLREQARTLLTNVEGLQIVELPEAEECCGFGGLFAVKMSDISGVMLNRKLNHVESTDADVLIGGDVSCLMHMAGGLQKRGSNIQVKHIAEVLGGEA